jgi:hypothetical protein
MRLEPLYRVTFTTPEAWSVEISGPGGVEGQSFPLAALALLARAPVPEGAQQSLLQLGR